MFLITMSKAAMKKIIQRARSTNTSIQDQMLCGPPFEDRILIKIKDCESKIPIDDKLKRSYEGMESNISDSSLSDLSSLNDWSGNPIFGRSIISKLSKGRN